MNPNETAKTWLEKALECVQKANGITERFLSYHPDYEYVRRDLNRLETRIVEAMNDIDDLGP